MRTTGFIDSGGRYHPGKKIEIDSDIASTEKGYRHDRQREGHRADLVQPWINGQPNQEFRELYPEESEKYFGQA